MLFGGLLALVGLAAGNRGHRLRHRALGQRPPSECYTNSARPYPARLAPLEYPAHCEVRLVSRNGGVRWHNRWVNLSHVLGGEYMAFEEVGDGLGEVRIGPVRLGRFHERLLRIEDERGDLARTRRRSAPVLPMSSD